MSKMFFSFITYTYDENGHIGYRTRMTDASGETHWTYDARGRMTSENKTVYGQSFITRWQYDTQDRVIRMTYPDNEVLYYSYLPQGGIKTVNSNRASLLTNTLVDGHGRIRQSTYADKNGDTDSPYIKNVDYHAWLGDAGRLSAMSASRTTATDSAWYLGLGLNYDGVGNITNLQDNMNGDGIEKQVQTFTYDALNRLVTASTSDVGEGQYSQSYGYDPNTGNLINKSDIGAYSYDASRPHAVAQAGTNQYQYDANGNMITRSVPDGQGGTINYSYTYNADNRIVEIKKNDVTARRMSYDGNGNRVYEIVFEGFMSGQEEKTVFISNYYEETIRGTSDSIQSVPDSPYKMYFPFVGGPGQLYSKSYYYADGERIAMRHGQSYYYVFGDHLGSTTTVVERETGRTISRQLYHPWGTTRYSYPGSGEKITDYGYTGQMQVDDIYYYNARWYDPAIGRFLQADTLVPPHQGTQGFDRYAYVNNNPLRYIDPEGKMTCDVNGNCFIEGWRDEYLMYQGYTNKCAIYSLAMGVSVIYGTAVDVDTLDNGWLWTSEGIDWGIPPILQPSGVNPIYRNVTATYMNGGKKEIVSLLEQDLPVVVTFAFPLWGHSVLAIGYNTETDQVIFADPATGTKRFENEFLETTKNHIYKSYPWTNPNKNRFANANVYDTLDSFLQNTDMLMFVPPRSLTVLRRSFLYHGGGKAPSIPITAPGGRDTINLRQLY